MEERAPRERVSDFAIDAEGRYPYEIHTGSDRFFYHHRNVEQKNGVYYRTVSEKPLVNEMLMVNDKGEIIDRFKVFHNQTLG